MVPVAIFTFRRPAMLRSLLDDLGANAGAERMPVFVFSDAGRDETEQLAVDEARRLCRQSRGFGALTLVEREHNLGCAANVIDGVGRVLQDHEAVIVLEEDLRLSPGLLDFMQRALDTYRDRRDIFSISAFSPPPELVGIPATYTEDVYLSRRNASWGWATWRDRWQQVDWEVRDYASFRHDRARRRSFDLGGNDMSSMLDAQMAGRIDSWAIRFSYAHFTHRAYTLCPRWSLTDHAGDDGSGIHVPKGGGCRVDLSRALAKPELPPDLKPDTEVLEALRRYHGEHWLSAMLGAVPGVRSLVRRTKARLGISGRLL